MWLTTPPLIEAPLIFEVTNTSNLPLKVNDTLIMSNIQYFRQLHFIAYFPKEYDAHIYILM